jgi:hypothetical protein
MATRTRSAAAKQRGALALVPDTEPTEGEVIKPLTKAAAERITRQIRAGLGDWHELAGKITGLAIEAYRGQAFKAMGYASWQHYTSAQFGDLELPRTTQEAINAALINTGEISARSAAAISGTDHKTAAKDAAKAAGGESSPRPAARRTGADGKRQPASKTTKRPASKRPAAKPASLSANPAYQKITEAATAGGWSTVLSGDSDAVFTRNPEDGELTVRFVGNGIDGASWRSLTGTPQQFSTYAEAADVAGLLANGPAKPEPVQEDAALQDPAPESPFAQVLSILEDARRAGLLPTADELAAIEQALGALKDKPPL